MSIEKIHEKAVIIESELDHVPLPYNNDFVGIWRRSVNARQAKKEARREIEPGTPRKTREWLIRRKVRRAKTLPAVYT